MNTIPYNSSNIRLSSGQDRRRKLTEEQKEEIAHKYKTGLYSQRTLAKEYNVSRRLVTFIVNPENYNKAKQQAKERRKDGRYKYTKEEWASVMREHRKYKQDLYLKGELKVEDK